MIVLHSLSRAIQVVPGDVARRPSLRLNGQIRVDLLQHKINRVKVPV